MGCTGSKSKNGGGTYDGPPNSVIGTAHSPASRYSRKHPKHGAATATTPTTRPRTDTWEQLPSSALLAGGGSGSGNMNNTDGSSSNIMMQQAASHSSSATGGGGGGGTHSHSHRPSSSSSSPHQHHQHHHQHAAAAAAAVAVVPGSLVSVGAASTASQSNMSYHDMMKRQWHALWDVLAAFSPSNSHHDHHGILLTDPEDVVSVIQEDLKNRFLDRKLSQTQITFIQRQIRRSIKDELPASLLNNHSKTTKAVVSSTLSKVVGGHRGGGNNGTGSSHNNHSSHHHHQDQYEDREMVEKQHLLPYSILRVVLPESNAQASIIVLIMSLSLFGHIQTVAMASTELLSPPPSSDADKNNNNTTTTKEATGGGSSSNLRGGDSGSGGSSSTQKPVVLRPSQVPILHHPAKKDGYVYWPNGAPLADVAVLLGMAVSGTRNQKLQLLFYVSLNETELRNFLLSHPSGGFPHFLLEVDENVVLSLTSLLHYHYYGTAFLPPSGSKYTTRSSSTTSSSLSVLSTFCPSRSKPPLAISKARLQSLLEWALADSDDHHVDEDDHNNNNAGRTATSDRNYNDNMPKLNGDNNTHRRKESSSMILLPNHYGSSTTKTRPSSHRHRDVVSMITPSHHRRGKDPEESGVNGNGDETSSSDGSDDSSAPVSKLTKVMRKLNDAKEGALPEPFYISSQEADESLSAPESLQRDPSLGTTLTLEDFKAWSGQHLDDVTLDRIMYRLFGQGLLPSPHMEGELVAEEWQNYQKQQSKHKHTPSNSSVSDLVSNSMSMILGGGWNNNNSSNSPDPSPSNHGSKKSSTAKKLNTDVWGGLGNIDGRGGLGYGVLYCIPTEWWKAWTRYSGLAGLTYTPHCRPPSLSTEPLLLNDGDDVFDNKAEEYRHTFVIRGIMGSYEIMKPNLKCGRDYVLIPPGVWDVLYELYGGGPPLPRMVQEPAQPKLRSFLDAPEDEQLAIPEIPSNISVLTHPWIIHVHLCDPLQPYRRGAAESGSMSIRVMASPSQPLWRLVGEVICRVHLQNYKAFDSNHLGMARLWKRSEVSKDNPQSRYGPWNLLCKSRHAMLPLISDKREIEQDIQALIADWNQYADSATVESIGLVDQDSLMLEFAVQNRNGDLTWPREQAAKAGKVRRLAEEDRKFRQLLQGVDDNGNALINPPNLVGMDVDAMDPSGRWYTVKILEVDITDEETDEEPDEDEEVTEEPRQVARKKVKVIFKDHGGHFDWIDVESDRLQTAGRFAHEAEQDESASSSPAQGSNGDGRSRSAAGSKRTNSNADNALDNTKSCPLPGFGACGLTNLGNTCYMNSAVQCIAYTPILRSYLLSAQYKATGDLNKDNPLGTGGKLLEEFADLLRTMWSSRLAEKSPNRFRTHLSKTNGQFAGADQQDAQEFLNFIIDVLHEDSNRVRKKPYVENLEDSWVEKTSLPRVGEEAWRRFLRRNRSIMADVAMGQTLNTVTCPVCHYSSRKFEPFNDLKIPVPAVADVIFQCTVVRRATAQNCPLTLNRPRKKDNRDTRFTAETSTIGGPPSEGFIAEQYVIAMSRLADCGDLRLQIQNLSGIRAINLRLCRTEEAIVHKDAEEGSPTKRQIKVIPLHDKDGPISQHAKKRAPDDDGQKVPTQIIAFECTLNTRRLKANGAKDEEVDQEDPNNSEDESYPSRAERAELEKYLLLYGDEQECRFVDTDPIAIAKAMSRSLWPTCDSELKIGLRVDAKDHRGNWYPGSVVDVFDDEVSGGDADTGQEVTILQKRVQVHFDNFLPKWDEVYTVESFKKGRVNPLYSHAEPKLKPTEFFVHHRFKELQSGFPCLFGQSFFVQCHKEWSNARAGAHILAQAARFLEQDLRRIPEKVHSDVSNLIDLLVDCDREFVKLSLGVSRHNSEEERDRPYRNPSHDFSMFISAVNKKISAYLHRLPFELIICTIETASPDKRAANTEEVPFPFVVNRTIGNFVSIQNAVILQWRESPVDKKSVAERSPTPNILYCDPKPRVHESSADILRKANMHENGRKARPASGGIDLTFCLTEFCKVQKLLKSDNWICPRCKVVREGSQNLSLWRMPDLLVLHIKRFNMSARWQEKITTKVNFPMTGFNVSQWCHRDSPVLRGESEDSYVYDLIGVMNHYGSMTGGHYIATCKATHCGRDGREEVAYNFSGAGASPIEMEGSDEPSGWGLVRTRTKVNQKLVDAVTTSRAFAESAEPLWLQFDDEVVEQIPPRHVVSEMAYVLFYRKRRITPSNIAKYSTLE